MPHPWWTPPYGVFTVETQLAEATRVMHSVIPGEAFQMGILVELGFQPDTTYTEIKPL
jgi:hypothetical protein